MIPNSVITAFLAAAVCTVLVPAALLLILGGRRQISGLPLLCGAAAFFLSQIVLRLPLLQALSELDWYRPLSPSQWFFWYALCLALSAGLFEESARLGGALLLKKHRSYKDVLSFGLGHALCETILLAGLSHIGNAAVGISVNTGGAAAAAFLPAGQLERTAALLAAVNPADIYWGICERFSAVLFHLFATVLVFRGVVKRKIRYTLAAILAHTLFNLLVVLGVLLLPPPAVTAVTETALLVVALGMGWYVVKSRGIFTALRPNGADGNPPPADGGQEGAAAEDLP